jgi:hypothetical protein
MSKRRKPALFSSRFLVPLLVAAFIPSLLLTVYFGDHMPATWWEGNEDARTHATVVAFFVVYGVIGTAIVLLFRVAALLRQDNDEVLGKWLRSKGFRRRAEFWRIAATTEPFGLEGDHHAELAYVQTLRGQEVALLMYCVDTGTSKAPEPRRYTVVAASGNGSFPVTTVAPRTLVEGLFEVVASAVGLRSQRLESAEFNRRWRVISDDLASAHAMIHSRVMERLLRPDARGIRVTWDGDAIMCVQKGNGRRHTALENRINLVVDLANLVPGFARTDGGATGYRSHVPVLVSEEKFSLDPLPGKIGVGAMAVALATIPAFVVVAALQMPHWDAVVMALLVVMIVALVVGFKLTRITYLIERARRRWRR